MAFKTLGRWLAWLRGARHRKLLHKALSLHTQHRDDEQDADFLALISHQMAPWRQPGWRTGRPARDLLRHLNTSSASVFVFEVDGTQVDVWPKRAAAGHAPADAAKVRMFHKRVNQYRTLLHEVCNRYQHRDAYHLVMDMEDIPAECPDWPIFGFQKQKAAANLLLPDVDFFHQGWYQTDTDPTPYLEKSVTACFVGSSTGAQLDVKTIAAHNTPRLRLASQFLDDPRVLFRIAQAAQCDSEEARRLLLAQPYFSEPVSWGEQLRHRFLLSIDGNGATCSRVVKSLRSHAVLVKFQSDHELFYFPLMHNGVHYLQVQGPQDVHDILDKESAQPGHYRSVAQAGQAFADKTLCAAAVLQYTHLMLQQYAVLLRESGSFGMDCP